MNPSIVLTVAGLALAVSASGKLSAIDADRDGIPRKWELAHGTSDDDAGDAELDFDGDGLSTLVEYATNGRPWGRYERICFAKRAPGSGSVVQPAGR